MATGAKADVKINSTHFPDEVFRNNLKKQDIGNFCGSQPYLTTEDVENTKELYLGGKGITSLTGIEFFHGIRIFGLQQQPAHRPRRVEEHKTGRSDLL